MDVHCSLFTQVTVRRTLTLCSWLEKTCIHDRKQENRQILFHLFYIKVGNSDGLRWKKKKREFPDVLTDTSNNRSCRHIRRLHQNIWQLACLFSKKRVLNQEIWIYPRDKKKKVYVCSSTNFNLAPVVIWRVHLTKTEIAHLTSSSSSSGLSTLPPEWPNCQRAPSLSSFSRRLWNTWQGQH